MASHGVPRASGLVDRSEAARRKEHKKIDTYKTLVEQLRIKIDAEEYTPETLLLTSNLLTQNPEYYTVWNNRRLLLQDVFSKELAAPLDESATSQDLTSAQQEILLLIQEDLQFLIPLLKGYPKCYWIWNHRAWLLRQASEHLPTSSAQKLWEGELGLVGKMLSYDSRNFHGWSYRREVISALKHLSQEHTESESEPKSTTEHEFAYTTKMIKTNLSNFSAWHNRSKLIPTLLRERNADAQARRKLMTDEFDLITEALYTDPYDQSLWFYHNYLMSTLVPEAAGTDESSLIVLDLTSQEITRHLEDQLTNLRDILDGTDDCKYVLQALLTYAAKYRALETTSDTITNADMASWIAKLEELDPLRKGRWRDLRTTLGL